MASTTRCAPTILLAGLLLAAAAAADPAPAPPDSGIAPAPVPVPDPATGYPAVPYRPGERLVFSIDYGPINAGEGTLEVVGIVEREGVECYHIESRATSNRFFSTFYKVRDKVTTHIDRRRLDSRFFEKRLREGNYRKHVEIVFDQEAGKARYHDGRVFDTMPGIHDVLSAFYFVRTLELEVGQRFGVMTHSSRKNYSLEVIVHGRERVEVPAGTFDCFVVEPVIIGEGLFQHEGKLTIWMTADERRLPVLMKTKVKVGSIDASLKEFALGGAAGGAPPGR